MGSSDHTFRIAGLVLFVLGMIYFFGGTIQLLFWKDHRLRPDDLGFRLREEVYFWHRMNPYDYKTLGQVETALESPEYLSADEVKTIKETGPAEFCNYPHFTYLMATLFVPPGNINYIKYHFFVLCSLALGFIFAWVYRQFPDLTGPQKFFLASTALAIYPNYRVLYYGSYDFFVVALLLFACAIVNSKYNRFGFAGIPLALCFVKPQDSLLVGWYFVIHRKWASVLVTSVIIVGSYLISGWIVKTSFADMLSQVSEGSRALLAEGVGYTNLTLLLINAGMPPDIARNMMLLFGIIVSGVLSWRYRHNSIVVQLAILCVISRVYTYHWFRDNIILVPMVAFLAVNFIKKKDIGSFLAFLMVELSLCIPNFIFRILHISFLTHLIIWIGALVYVVVTVKPGRAPTEPISENNQGILASQLN